MEDTFSKSSLICDSCIRRISGECDEFGLETSCGIAYEPITINKKNKTEIEHEQNY